MSGCDQGVCVNCRMNIVIVVVHMSEVCLGVTKVCLCELQDASSSEKKTVYQCMWRGCSCRFDSSDDVESHIRSEHLSYVFMFNSYSHSSSNVVASASAVIVNTVTVTGLQVEA